MENAHELEDEIQNGDGIKTRETQIISPKM